MLNDKTEKSTYAPSYYNDFKCIADKCRHSCCIDWEICIDETTYAKYKQTGDILNTVKECEDGPCFALRENGRCPHLNDSGLCNIILSYGKDFLSDICRNHPRFYNYISDERTEAGIGLVCEEACRLILENEKPFSLFKTDDPDNGDFGGMVLDNSEADFNALAQRDRIISIIEATDVSFDEKIAVLKAEFKLSELYTPDKWLDRFLSLEILEPDWEQALKSMRGKFLRKNCENTDKYGKYYERLLTYFVYRHVSVSDSEDNLRARLAFCILSVQVITSLFEENPNEVLNSAKAPEKLIDWARRYSAEIEYSEDNTAELIYAFAIGLI